MGSYCSMGTKFQFCKMERVLEMNGGDGSTACEYTQCHRHCTLRNDSDGKFDAMCILPQLKQ